MATGQLFALAKLHLTLYLVLDDDALHLRPIYLLLLVATSGPADVRASLSEPENPNEIHRAATPKGCGFSFAQRTAHRTDKPN
jgi:hypothetical protein